MYMCTHALRPSVSTHTQRHTCTTQTFNAIDPHTLLAHTFNTHTRTDQRYVPNMQTAKGVYVATFKCIQLWLCTRMHAHIHHSTFNSLQWDSKWVPASPLTPSSSYQKEGKRNAMNETSLVTTSSLPLKSPLLSLSLWAGDCHTVAIKRGRERSMLSKHQQSPRITTLGVDGKTERGHSFHRGKALAGTHLTHITAAGHGEHSGHTE